MELKNGYLKRWIQTFLIAAITAGLVWFIRDNWPLIKKILIIRPSYVALIMSLLLIGRVMAGLRIKLIVGLSGVKLRFMEWFGTAVITNFYNSFFFKGGVALTAIYLKNNHRLNYSKYVSLTIGSMSMVGLSAAIIGIACSLYGYFKGAFDLALAVIFAVMLIGVVIVLLLPGIRFPRKKIFKLPNTLFECWDVLRGDKITVLKLFILETTVLCLFALRYYLTFKMFEIPVPFYVCLILCPFNIVTNVVSIIPNAYGVREAVVGFASKLAGIGFTGGVMATLVNRVLMMIVSFTLTPVFSYYLMGNFKVGPAAVDAAGKAGISEEEPEKEFCYDEQ